MASGTRQWRLARAPTIVALVALGVAAIGAAFAGWEQVGERGQLAAGMAVVTDCTGTAALDYLCHQDRLHGLVLEDGVDAALAQLKDDYDSLGLIRAGCHQLTHAIGRAAADRAGGIAAAYAVGDPFCSAGYYHGAAEAVVARLGAEAALANPDALCAGLGEHPRHSIFHRNCAHGLGHGFMRVYANEVPSALAACEMLSDNWERQSCYGGVFMENTVASMTDPSQPAKYLRPEQPLFPCDAIAARFRNMCYAKQAAYALATVDGDFARVFALCATVEDAFQAACEQGLGTSALVHAAKYVIGDATQALFVREVCLLGTSPDAEANCVAGAARAAINYYQEDDGSLTALCNAFNGDLGDVCLTTSADKKMWPD